MRTVPWTFEGECCEPEYIDPELGIQRITESELYARLKKTVGDIDRGLYRDAEVFEAEFDDELKAAYGL